MRRVLILFAHPRLENSRVNRRLIDRIPQAANFTFHDLYENYPDFNIDIEREKSLLIDHEIVVWHHPFYWYSCPPLLKQWIDMVLEYGWAYGTGGEMLKGKMIFNAITTGGNLDAYCPEGYNCYSIPDFIKPFEQTARLCHMEYLPPFAVMGTHKMNSAQMDHAAEEYERVLEMVGTNGFELKDVADLSFLNQLLAR
ncbi:MAG: NAD(P)H oxidoreductase [Acidobacteria bacterium]|nr:MAG: NAD(P)H oxidoreductase [Acidobacteriota bacterium]REK04164.1 MAG: NAD(P)H oxidoreductase [Acidobacteriota bacterium]REK15326.1 MAG: NAD(P)H oxidoreductase [Acidobacteriota bacterium]REK46416.1 MAG: NAD(P)H oxidoreductase [Acidobacteriota bacterium]